MPESAGCVGPTVLPREKRTPRCVRPARQSEDCLRERPLSGARLFASVRSALGPMQPAVARGALAGNVSPPLRADACAPFGFGLAESALRKLRFLRRIAAFASGLSPAHPSAQAGAWTGAEYRPRPLRLACAASAQSRRPQRLWPRGRLAVPRPR